MCVSAERHGHSVVHAGTLHPPPTPLAALTTPHPLCSLGGFFSSDHVHALRLLVWDGGGRGGCPGAPVLPRGLRAACGARLSLPPTPCLLISVRVLQGSDAPTGASTRPLVTQHSEGTQAQHQASCPSSGLGRTWREAQAQAHVSDGSAAASGPSKSRALGRARAPLPVGSGNAGRSASPHGLHPRP